jgi:hypothetical protein
MPGNARGSPGENDQTGGVQDGLQARPLSGIQACYSPAHAVKLGLDQPALARRAATAASGPRRGQLELYEGELGEYLGAPGQGDQNGIREH